MGTGGGGTGSAHDPHPDSDAAHGPDERTLRYARAGSAPTDGAHPGFREYLLTAEHAPRLVCVLECAKRNSSSPSEPISDPSNRYAIPETTPGPKQEGSSSTPAQSPANADTQSKKKLNATDAQIAALSPAERELFDKLRHWRYQHAQAEGVPPYVVLTNRQLLAVVRSKPNRKSGLAPQPHGSLAQGCPIHPDPAARKPRPRCP
jgi:hypothetical protein